MAKYTDDLIPDMTSNTAPSGVASCSDTIGGARIAFRAFDDSNVDGGVDCWHSANVAHPHWIRYQSTLARIVAKYTVSARDGGANCPEDFTFEGSNNGANFDVLDTLTGQSWASRETKIYYVDIPASYIYHQLNISKSTSGDNYVAVGEIEIMEIIPPPVGGFSGGQPWIWMQDMWEKHDKLWTPKGIIIPEGV